MRQGLRFLRAGLPQILATRTDVLSPRMVHLIEALAGDWRRLDERIEGLSADIETLVQHDPACQRLMTVPGIGPIISSAMVAAIGRGEVFSKGRDLSKGMFGIRSYAARLGEFHCNSGDAADEKRERVLKHAPRY